VAGWLPPTSRIAGRFSSSSSESTNTGHFAFEDRTAGPTSKPVSMELPLGFDHLLEHLCGLQRKVLFKVKRPSG